MPKDRCLCQIVLFMLLIFLADCAIAEPYITTSKPTILFSVNDSEALNLLEEGPDAAVPAGSVMGLATQ